MANKKIILFSLVLAAALIGALTIASQYLETIPGQEPYSKNGYPVDPALANMTLSLSSGEILGVRISEDRRVFIDIDPDADGRLVIADLWTSLNQAFPDLNLMDYVIQVDDQEVVVDEISLNVVAISVKEDSQRVEIVYFLWI